MAMVATGLPVVMTAKTVQSAAMGVGAVIHEESKQYGGDADHAVDCRFLMRWKQWASAFYRR